LGYYRHLPEDQRPKFRSRELEYIDAGAETASDSSDDE